MPMSETSTALTLQMLEWIGAHPRDYREVMEAWRTSCPRLTIWEDAWTDGLLARDPDTGQVSLTDKGAALLSRRQR
jgi:hypothetical protein